MDKELEIQKMHADSDADANELIITINDDDQHAARNVLADDEHGIYLRYDLETERIIGALIFHPDEWFEKIARAFATQDLENPDVRFFLKKKIEQLAQQTSPSH